jgi:hypothetical protein
MDEVCCELEVVAATFHSDLPDDELGVSFDQELPDPRDRATVSPKIKASYSAMLLVASKSSSTMYFTCSPFGSMRTTPAPAFLLRADPSKKSVQWGPVNTGALASGGRSDPWPEPPGTLGVGVHSAINLART